MRHFGINLLSVVHDGAVVVWCAQIIGFLLVEVVDVIWREETEMSPSEGSRRKKGDEGREPYDQWCCPRGFGRSCHGRYGCVRGRIPERAAARAGRCHDGRSRTSAATPPASPQRGPWLRNSWRREQRRWGRVLTLAQGSLLSLTRVLVRISSTSFLSDATWSECTFGNETPPWPSGSRPSHCHLQLW